MMTSSSDKEVKLRRPLTDVRVRLQAQTEEGEQIIKYPIGNEHELKLAKEAVASWYDYTRDLLLNLFSTDKMQQEFVRSVRSFGMYLTFPQKIEEHRQHLDSRLNTLRSIAKRLDLFEENTVVVETTLAEETKSVSKKTVFVAHGRNEQLKKSMFDFLRAIDLNPLEWPQALAATEQTAPYIGDILKTSFSRAQAIVVLLSGDDVARLRGEFIQVDDADYEKNLTPQPRPNVIFEAGIAMGRNPDRTILVQVGKLRPWSDIAGRHITHLNNTPQKRQELANKLKTAGCEVNTSGQDWYTAGDFSDEPKVNQEENSNESTLISVKSEVSKKLLVLAQAKDLLSRVEQALKDNDPILDVDFRVEYFKILQNSLFEWSLNNNLLNLKAELSIFDTKRILRDDKLGGLKWTLNSVRKMLIILDNLGT